MLRKLSILFLATQIGWAYQGSDPQIRQKEGADGVEAYLQYLRKTGDTQSAHSRLDQAEEALKASYEAFLNRQDLASAALSAVYLGSIHRLENNWNEANAYFTKARDLAHSAGNKKYEAQALIGLARVEYIGRNDLSKSAAFADEAARVSSAAGDQEHLFDALDLKAEIEDEGGNIDAGLEYLNRALAIESTSILKDDQLYFGYMGRADLYRKRVEVCNWERDFEPCKQALALARTDYEHAFAIAQKAGFDFLAKTAAQLLQGPGGLGNVEEILKGQERSHKLLVEAQRTASNPAFRPRKAADVVVSEIFSAPPGGEEAASLAATVQLALKENPDMLKRGDSRSFYIQGMVQYLQGDGEAALNNLLKATDVLEQERGRLQDEQTRGAFLADKMDIYNEAILQLLQRRRFEEAFSLMERSRSRGLADLLASRELALGSSQEGALFADSLKIRARIAVAQERLVGLRVASESMQRKSQIDQAESEIRTLEDEYRQINERMMQQSPRAKELVLSQPVSLLETQRQAGEGQYDVVYFLVLNHAIIVLHISKYSIEAKNIFLWHPALTEKIGALLVSLKDPHAPPFDSQTAGELYLYLIQPILPYLKTNHLIIIPNEELNYLPFQVLMDPASGAFAGERFRISYAPSATVLARMTKKENLKEGRLLALADPSLKDAINEVTDIGRLYPGRSKVVANSLATKSQARTWVAEFNLVHFAVHGQFDQKDPLLSSIHLGKTAEDNGELTSAEMFGLPLMKDSMVVLSACESGQARATHANDVIGMTRALLYAGANTVILSSWKIESSASSLWMQTFYREAQTKPVTEAARLALIAVKARPEYKHPRYWAPFVITGK